MHTEKNPIKEVCNLILEIYVQLLNVCYMYLSKYIVYGTEYFYAHPWNCFSNFSNESCTAANPQFFFTTKIKMSYHIMFWYCLMQRSLTQNEGW